MYPLVRELAVDGIPVTATRRVLKLARQPYYRWLASPVGCRDLDRAYLANAVFDAHADDPEYGYRLLADEARQAGEEGCDRAVWGICRDQQWWSAFGKRRAKNGKKPGPPAHDDRVRRDFHADKPNALWLTDISEHPTSEGKLYLCAVKDVYSERIVGYSISDRMKSRLAVDALTSAVARCAVESALTTGCVVHSDRGSQGGFNPSSQHLDAGGGQGWRRATGPRRPAMRPNRFVGSSGVLIGRCGRRCIRLVGRTPRGWCSGSSGG